MVRQTYITRSRTQAELKQSYFQLVLVQDPTDQVGQALKWYRVEDYFMCKWSVAVSNRKCNSL
jgi:hypothetical protein